MSGHKAGKLRQQNKGHKTGTHASKRSVERRIAGRKAGADVAERRGGGMASSVSAAKARKDRANQIVQLRRQKVEARMIERRLGLNGGAGQGPPRVVGVLALGASADAAAAAAALVASGDEVVSSPVPGAVGNPVTAVFRSQRQRMTVFVVPRPVADGPGAGDAAMAAACDPSCPVGTGAASDLVATLEAARGCDLLLFALDVSQSPDDAIDAVGDIALAGLRAAGLPSTAACLQGLDGLSMKARSEALKWGRRLVATELGDDCKTADQSSTAALIRAVTTAKPRAIAWRERRSALIAHAVDFVEDEALTSSAHAAGITTAAGGIAAAGQPMCPLAADVAARRAATDAAAAAAAGAPAPAERFGTLVVGGWLRGPPLSARSLVHVSRMGTFRLARVTEEVDPAPLKASHANTAAAAAAAGAEAPATRSATAGIRLDGPVLVEATAGGETMESLAAPDPSLDEQTWPTAEEERVADEAERLRRLEHARRKRGIDDYSSAWLVGDDVDFTAEDGAGVPDDIDEEDEDDDDDEDDEDEDDEDGHGRDMDDDENFADDALRELCLGVADPPPPDKSDPATRRQLFESDKEFPDEVDTPVGQPARSRFARYRGLESFRTAAWDKLESLPPSYARLFAFSDFMSAKRSAEAVGADAARAMAAAEGEVMTLERAEKLSTAQQARKGRAGATGPGVDITGGASSAAAASSAPGYAASVGAGTTLTASATAADLASVLAERTGEALAPPGRYVVLHVAGVPASLLSGRPGDLPLLVTSLLRHEGRTSVLHTQLQRTVLAPDCAMPDDEDDDEEEAEQSAAGAAAALASDPVKSKDELEFHIGFRAIDARPVFSSRSTAGGRHQARRWMPASGFAMASILAPVAFPPLPVLSYRRRPLPAGAPAGALGPAELVATGSVIGADPHQLLLKRTLLTGAPIRSKKRWAVVRSMFFNPEDVMWFRPVELHTKHGAKGRIRDSVGTHGLFKANFNRPVPQHDTVCLPLWKRVFPKFGTVSYGQLLSASDMDLSVPLPAALRAALMATGISPEATKAAADAAAAGAAASSHE
ncbi:hypothetical protein FNF31_03337 [Cafeteria roenbergensis]|uniref:Bms1-type G domain-containing protein n=1 Tax=Cafeteria roenbergensis TaxID=33653 RepID=A0A5A8DAN6_CAFRO|nr:hypothetical protein FNF31_03337 [Cafeteria roenbergensis]